MKEPEFATFVNREREDYRKKPFAGRPDVDLLISTFVDKQKNMELDNKWSKLSMEQSQILFLLFTYKSNTSKSGNQRTCEDNGAISENPFKGNPPPWRSKGPKDDEPLEKVFKGGHTFKWNPLVNDGAGLWRFV